MTAGLVWGDAGDRVYESGVDRCILHLPGGPPIVWNGLTDVEETIDTSATPYYLDGKKYLEHQTLGDYSGKLTAYTYPKEFEACLGVMTRPGGLRVYDQLATRFDLSYRTLIGNDLDGTNHGYRIHFLWNLLATADDVSYSSNSEDPEVSDFSWLLSSLPTLMSGYRPTAHLSIDSTTMEPELFADVENLIYGTEEMEAYWPTYNELLNLTNPNSTATLIFDRGNGIWSAVGSAANVKLSNLAEQLFLIDGVQVSSADVNQYNVTSGLLPPS